MSGADSKKKKSSKSKTERKQGFFLKFSRLLEEYPKIVIANGDNVGSNQFQRIRIELRGKGIIVMGKKTIMRKVIRGFSASGKTQFDSLLPYVKGNVAFIFTKGDLHDIKKIADANKVQSPARSGGLAPNDVIVPAGNTGMEPTKTSFFQALSIPTKITKGQVEIISDVKLIHAGNKVDTSQATLLQMLNIKPFKYGLIASTVYDEGAIYEAKVLDITPEDILHKFHKGVQNIAALSLATGIPTLASVPHSIINGYKNVLSVALAVDFTFPALDELKKKLAAAPAPAAAAPAAAAAAAPKKEEKKKEEPKEEEDADMGLDLFG